MTGPSYFEAAALAAIRRDYPIGDDFTQRFRGRHSPAALIHRRNVSRLTTTPLRARCSAASVGPKPA